MVEQIRREREFQLGVDVNEEGISPAQDVA